MDLSLKNITLLIISTALLYVAVSSAPDINGISQGFITLGHFQRLTLGGLSVGGILASILMTLKENS